MKRRTPQYCQRCGKPVPSHRRDTGYCSAKCAKQQAKEDAISAQMEQDAQDDTIAVELPASAPYSLQGRNLCWYGQRIVRCERVGNDDDGFTTSPVVFDQNLQQIVEALNSAWLAANGAAL
ncbi:MAG TPA: hypothetical protein VJS69_01245 [Candidatus Krumholzibacteria bacterium]|nr:hypothetical protein [Candidatus Krumholzibacteria bacterium]